VLLWLLHAERVHDHPIDQVFVNLLPLLDAAVEQEHVAFGLAVEHPRVVDQIVSVDVAHVRVKTLTALLNPVLVLLRQICAPVNRIVVEFPDLHAFPILPLQVCLKEVIEHLQQLIVLLLRLVPLPLRDG
jgi:hypothetical protein